MVSDSSSQTQAFDEFLSIHEDSAYTLAGDGQGHLVLSLHGDWTTLHVARLEQAINKFWRQVSLLPEAPRSCYIHTGNLLALDISGTLILHRSISFLRDRDCSVEVEQTDGGQLDFVSSLMEDTDELDRVPPKPGVIEQTSGVLAGIGKSTLDSLRFLGQSAVALGAIVLSPKRLRGASLVHHIEHTGLRAMPVVALMAFLISIVLAYQGTAQLSRFGAEIFTIDLVAISILREMGVLLTAIMVAGRSGSAFAAEIGVMKLNQEIAAMQTLGISPMNALAVPRIVALLITMPMLTLLAILVGFTGAAVVCILSLDIPLELFIERLQSASSLTHFMVGMAKAPVFAFLIAVIGVRQGLLVEQSAAEVGHNTTQAVVQAIFAVIAADAVFSIMTTELGI